MITAYINNANAIIFNQKGVVMPEELIFLLPLALMIVGAIYVYRNPHGGNSKKQNGNRSKIKK